jgi:hypothetical protein
VGLENVEKRTLLTLPGLELRPLGRPVCSQSLYRLPYPGFLVSMGGGWKYFYLLVSFDVSSTEPHVLILDNKFLV